MAVTRGTTRYPANCPAPCPAGAIIMPTATSADDADLTSSRTAPRLERINQLDLKVSRTFRFGRISVLPTFEVFNINNSDAIISYVSTNVLSASTCAQQHHAGPHHGVGIVTRW